MEYIENSFIPTILLYISHHSSMSFSILLSGWHFFILLNPDDLLPGAQVYPIAFSTYDTVFTSVQKNVTARAISESCNQSDFYN